MDICDFEQAYGDEIYDQLFSKVNVIWRNCDPSWLCTYIEQHYDQYVDALWEVAESKIPDVIVYD